MYGLGGVSFSIGFVKCKALTLPYGVVFFGGNTLINYHSYFSALEAKKWQVSING